MKFLQGKKTFITVGVFAILAIMTLLVNVAVPDWAWTIVAALGFGFVRSAITHLSRNSGWKTYTAVVVAIGLSAVQVVFGLTIPPDILTAIYSALGAFGVVGVRDALSKIPKN